MTPLEITLTIICLYLFTFYKIKNRKIENSFDELIWVIAPIFLVVKFIQNIFKFIFDEWYPKV